MIGYNSFAEFAEVHEGDVFMFWVYRRLFTPYEQQEAFMDESYFEDAHAQSGRLVECVPLGERSDYLLGFQIADEDGIALDYLEYYRLSELRLALNTHDEQEG